MDEKHRQYCIRLGNPYMRQERYEQQFNKEENSSWIPETKLEQDNWFYKNKSNF